ncbi:MAG: hypothetical protein OEL83_16835 [Desulforhopalus sp.]|nr:hypothetical protein [Desulforhopalus sp.]
MSTPTLQQKLGQLFLIGFAGDSLSPGHPIAAAIAEGNLGGVILFDRLIAEKKDSNNIINPEQLRRLTKDLQDLADGDLLIAVDQEGGKVNRFKGERGFPTSPAAAELGSSPNIRATTASARKTARMLRQVGVNLNLAPVVDLNINRNNPIIGRYDRSFSDNPQTVAAHAAAWIREHHAEGIHCCLKHFPGHGSSTGDSHLGFVDITLSWQESELEPYKTLIATGLAEAVMVGHLINRNFDPQFPATLSAATVRSLLRRKLGFTGLIISDDMQMKAITDHCGLEDACCKALAAGVDLLIIGNNLVHDPAIFTKAVHAVERAVQGGEVSPQRVAEAYGNVQKFKQSLRDGHGS